MGSIDTSTLKIEDLTDMFSYGIISHKDLEEELKKRKFILDVHGEIISGDSMYEEVKRELLRHIDGEISFKDFQRNFGDFPSQIFSPIYDAVLLEITEGLVKDDPIKKKRWEILDFN